MMKKSGLQVDLYSLDFVSHAFITFSSVFPVFLSFHTKSISNFLTFSELTKRVLPWIHDLGASLDEDDWRDKRDARIS